jgi:hypothetical protein
MLKKIFKASFIISAIMLSPVYAIENWDMCKECRCTDPNTGKIEKLEGHALSTIHNCEVGCHDKHPTFKAECTPW